VKGRLGFRYAAGLAITAAIVIFAAVEVSGSGLLSAAPTADPRTLSALETTSLASGQQLPPIVARVGKTDITSSAFAREVTFATEAAASRHENLTEGQIWRKALDNLIQDAALYERAKSEGITVSGTEISDYVAKVKAGLAASMQRDPATASRVKASIAAAGDADFDTYMKDPKVVASYRRNLMKAKLIAAHLGQGASPSAVTAFIQQTIAQANVQVFITLPS